MLADSEFKWVVAYIKNHSGIDLSQKRVMVEGRLETYFLRSGMGDFEEFMARVEGMPNGEAAEALINVLTTNHTYFMRESMHFEYMQKVVLPYLKVREQDSRDLRIWSAAASTGEEPYTLAMLLMDFFGLEHAAWDTKVLATDISTKVLEHASAGVYAEDQLEPLPERWRRRFFDTRDSGECRIREELKNEVIFRRFNLMDPFPFRKRFHVVFLRNVMIYFKDDVKYRLLEKVYDFLEPGGYLFIGATESLDRSRIAFEYVEPSIYRKKV